jgi:hypothetical protein
MSKFMPASPSVLRSPRHRRGSQTLSVCLLTISDVQSIEGFFKEPYPQLDPLNLSNALQYCMSRCDLARAASPVSSLSNRTSFSATRKNSRCSSTFSASVSARFFPASMISHILLMRSPGTQTSRRADDAPTQSSACTANRAGPSASRRNHRKAGRCSPSACFPAGV